MMKRVIATLILVLFVLFTSPITAIKNINRIQNPPIRPEQIKKPSKYPNNPEEVERQVKNEFEYQYDYGTYGVVWYIPTPKEVIREGKGDCKSRSLLIASILEKKGIEYNLHISMFHWWVSYPEKNLSWYEDPESSVKEGDKWQLPNVEKTLNKMIRVKDQYYEMLWVQMPNWKKITLIIGLMMIWGPKLIKQVDNREEN